MSKESMQYEEFTITARPRQTEGSGTWSALLTISRGSGEDFESWLVSAGDVYKSRQEAVESCFDFARDLIDREMKVTLQD